MIITEELKNSINLGFEDSIYVFEPRGRGLWYINDFYRSYVLKLINSAQKR